MPKRASVSDAGRILSVPDAEPMSTPTFTRLPPRSPMKAPTLAGRTGRPGRVTRAGANPALLAGGVLGARRRSRRRDHAGREVIAGLGLAAGAATVVLARLGAQLAVEHRARAAEHAPGALAAGNNPGVAHPTSLAAGLVPAGGGTVLGRHGRRAHDHAALHAQPDVAVAVVVLTGEALGRL